MEKSVLIVAGGRKPSKKLISDYIKKTDITIAADKGGDYLKSLKIEPYALVGDFDSINKKSLSWFEKKGVRIHSTNVQKDETDTMLAIMMAVGYGAKIVYILGALGGRLDHLYANITLLQYAKSKGVEAILIDDKNRLFLSDSNVKIEMAIGDHFSIFAVSEDVLFNHSIGLKYPLDGLLIEKFNPIGVSNQVIDEKVEIDIENGTALIIISND